MFLRKLTVMIVPLLMLAGVCFLWPYLNGWGFWSNAAQGLLVGIVLALLLPLSGAGRKKEPFGVLLWVPCILIFLLILAQYLHLNGVQHQLFTMIPPIQEHTIFTETLFAAFMMTTAVRTRK